MAVRDALDANPLTISPDATIFQLIETILETKHTTAAVLDDQGRLLGMVGAHDIFRKIVPKYLKTGHNLMDVFHDGYYEEKFALFKETPVSSIMSTKLDSVHPDDAIIKAATLIVEKRRKTLPVIESNGAFVGLITRRSVLKRAYQLFS